MNKELAKTLTLALINYIDENRPEGTMDCSSGECVSLEKAFTEENFDSVEGFIQKKLSRLTEFETHLKWLIENGGSGIEHVKVGANELLAIAKKEILKDLPMWRRWENGGCGNSGGIPIAIVKRGIDYKLVSTLGIQGEQYIMLSNLEKLPGFKEDEK